ncbi:MAG: type III PLP-dependent enzyme [Alphaproteobacteria bacterium]|nr:type III PLP-dependent enzyme [Rhodospirillales bacterium]MCW9045465.1 type III PLP-dependent enzyme [Alphaproteobacteria bacterium]
MTLKIENFLAEQVPATPCLVVDLNVVRENYKNLSEAFPLARIFYAVKANPAAQVLDVLVEEGSAFDAASYAEIEFCLAAGAKPADLSYGNTIKKQSDIAAAFKKGVRLFAFDCEEELQKLAEAAPGASVFCRIATTNEGADWPLSKKFGCDVESAKKLMLMARDLGMDAHGISFHVGSQQTNADQWDIAIGKVAMIFTDLREAGLDLKMLNLGGGYAARYREEVPSAQDYGKAIMDSITHHFGNHIPEIILEPGRSVTASAGIIESEVVLVSNRPSQDNKRWVYLDIGFFGGLTETMDEAIKYKITTLKDGAKSAAVNIAGPTCDGVDILYEKANYQMPLTLKSGDKVRIHAAGAYTATYASQSFNGLTPLQEYYL